MRVLTYRIEDAPDDPALVGGKAAALGTLARAGFAVPPGFVLTTTAFRSFLDESGGLRDAPWPDDLRDAFSAAYRDLCARTGDAPVAVRSSATTEDRAGASFAGQHVTVLNVRGAYAVEQAVVDCWFSLHSEEAAHYRRAHGVTDEAAMAVIVQALVPADASGVAFTIDPVSGDRDTVLIDAAWGLGEGVVDGAVTPDHFAVRKSGGPVTRRTIADKRLHVVPARGGGTAVERLPPARAREAALSDEQAQELAHLASRIEDLLGAPQDIEWALAGSRFFLLQSRPVTAAGQLEEWVSEFDSESHPDTVWTAGNVQEVLPDQLSPLNCTIMARMLEEFGMQAFERMGVRLNTPDPFNGMFYGRAFLNVTLAVEVADQVPFGNIEGVLEQFYDIPRELLPQPSRLSPAKLWRYANVVPRVLWFALRYPSEVERAERTIARFEHELAEPRTFEQSDEELLATIEAGLLPSAEVAITHISGAGLTSGRFDILRTLTRNWLGDEDGSLHARLCTGLASIESAQPAYELWDLSRLVLRSEPLRRAFEPLRGAEIARRLAAQQNEDVDRFYLALGGFLERHGHRSVMEAEIAARSWDEDLPTVFAMIRNYLHADPTADPRRIEERQRRERERATQECLRRLSWWQRPVFRRVLHLGQDSVVSREHTKSLLVRGTQRGRRLTRELARRLVARGLLDDVADLYYLTLDEVRASVRGELDRAGAQAQVRRRRAEQERNAAVVLPEYFRGRPKPLRADDLPLPEGDLLEGIPVSPGRVTGPARVILDPRVDAAIEPGEILVAPVTDAGWTPLFVAAAGVVVDLGGPLSHGSTVAREYGLPAVVNVKHGTRLIRTGQRITVDGARGVVVLEAGG